MASAKKASPVAALKEGEEEEEGVGVDAAAAASPSCSNAADDGSGDGDCWGDGCSLGGSLSTWAWSGGDSSLERRRSICV